jgi:hypothetical protein
MSPDTDRISVPTNGRGPHPDADPIPPEAQERPESPVSTAPFTPTQLAVGFGILASMVAILVARMRQHGRGRRRGPFGRG